MDSTLLKQLFKAYDFRSPVITRSALRTKVGSVSNRRTAGLFATLALLAGMLVLPGIAVAADGKTYVGFGDSIAAGLGIPGPKHDHPNEHRFSCERSNANYPSVIGSRLGLGTDLTGDWADFSCSGATAGDKAANPFLFGPTFSDQVSWATAKQTLGPRTKLVTVTIGANDIWREGPANGGVLSAIGACIWTSCGPNPPANNFLQPDDLTADLFVGKIAPAIKAIRSAAPNATIVNAIYPPTSPSTGPLCSYNDGSPLGSGTSTYIRSLWTAFESAYAEASRRLGLRQVDFADVFEGHDICQSQGVRWWARIGDKTAQEYHVTAEGQNAMGEKLVRYYTALSTAALDPTASSKATLALGKSKPRVRGAVTFKARGVTSQASYRVVLSHSFRRGGNKYMCSAPSTTKRTFSGDLNLRGKVPARLSCIAGKKRKTLPLKPAKYVASLCVANSRLAGGCVAGSAQARLRVVVSKERLVRLIPTFAAASM